MRRTKLICMVQYPRMKKWELLAAMQALAIYIIMRLDEGETEYNNFDLLLCKTVIVRLHPTIGIFGALLITE